MSQFYSRVFVQILDSSIAEDFTTRHIFEDFLKLCDGSGVVDMTRFAMSRRLNVPMETLNAAIARLEAPDPASRDQEQEGRRILPLDAHRDWGWIIVNYQKYQQVKTRADGAARVARHRASFDAAAGIEAVTDQPEIITAWRSWIQHRKEIKKPLTGETAKRQIAKLKEWGPARFLAALEHSTEKGWQGLFEPNDHGNNRANSGANHRPISGAEQRQLGIPATEGFNAIADAEDAAAIAKYGNGR